MSTHIFNSIVRIFLLPILLLLLQGNVSLDAQTRTFRGTESNLWDNPFNWEPFGLLPTASEDVVIDPTGPHTDVQMNIDVNIRSLEVKSGSLTVPAGKTLTVSNSVAELDGIKVITSLTNEGTINISNAGGNGVSVTGTFINSANLTIGPSSGSIGMDGISVANSLTNSGTINIPNAAGNGVSITGTFNNTASLSIGQNGGVGLVGIEIQGAGSNLNNDEGTIIIDNTGAGSSNKNGILNQGGQLTNQNSGDIQIGQNDGMISGKGLVGLGSGTTFINDNSVIKIDNTGTNDPTGAGSAIWLVNAVMFENKNGGQILIGQNGGNIGRDGMTISLNNCMFKNTNGIISIDNTGLNSATFGRGLDIGAGGTFFNEAAGQILIGQNAGQIKESGITISNATAVFTNNGGLVKIDQTGVNSFNGSSAAISLIGSASPHFTNKNNGEIRLGQLSGNADGKAIDNSGIFNNQGCNSHIYIFSDDLIIDNGSFTNEGVILENATGNSNISSNNGIVQNLNGGIFTVGSGNPAVNNGNAHIWQGCASSDWTTPDNWFLDGVPGNGAEVVIFNSPNDPEINSDIFLKSVHVGLDAQLTVQSDGSLEVDGATAEGLKNEGTILNQNTIRIGFNVSIAGDGIQNAGVFTNTGCATLFLSDNLNNSASFTNDGVFYIDTDETHSNTGTFTNNGLINFTFDNPVPSTNNNEIIIQPTVSENCGDISPAFDMDSPLDFNVQGIYNDFASFNLAGSYDAGTNTFTPNSILEEDTYIFEVVVENPAGGCFYIALWKLTTQNCCELPEAVCQPFEAALDGNGQINITAADVDGGSTADCGLQSLSIDLEDFDCSHIGTPQTVELTITDVNGDSDQCTATVTVVDNEQPTPVCLHPTVEFNGEAEIFLQIAQVWDEANSSDNCGEVYFIGMSPDKVTCEQLGTIVPLTVTVEDANGNTSECIAHVTVGGLPCGFSAPEEGINCNNSNQATYDVNTEIFTLTSDGCYDPSYYRSTDSHGYVGTELCGDGEVIAHITQINGNGWAGITMREGLGASDKMLQLMVDGVSMTRRELRQSTGATAFAHQFPTQDKNWLRLTRSGNTFGAYHSADGINWQAVLITNIPMDNCIEVGMLTINKSSSGAVTATFENFEVKAPSSLQAPDVQGVDIAYTPESTLEVYPNPAKGEAWVQFDQFDKLTGHFDGLSGPEMTIEVYNNMGQIIYEVPNQALEEQRIRLDVASWLPGMYLIQLKTDGQPMISKKLIVTD